MSGERIDGIKTRWTLVRHAHQTGDQATVAEARQELVMRYVAAVRGYLGAIVNDTELADELAQEFSLRMMNGDFAGADANRGRFRDLLKTAVRNMVKSHWDKANRRRPAEADLALIGDDSESAQDAAWTAAWQRSVIDQTWARMLAEDGERPSVQYRLLRLRCDQPEASSEALANELSRQIKERISPENCRQILRRARQRFANHLLDEVRAGLADESDDRVQQELADLGLLPWFRD